MAGATSSTATGGMSDPAQAAFEKGRQTFRYDTFGDEDFWGGTLNLHKAIEGQTHGGVGAGVSPKAALSVGLKVDAEALPADLVASIQAGQVNLDDPATTLALLKLNAVVGVTGVFASDGNLASVGIQCALCHSTVDDSFAPGIGKRLDGWPNRDLDVGAIVSLSPDLTPVAQFLGVDEPTVRQVLAGWGPGKFDAEVFLDGKGFRPDQDGCNAHPSRIRTCGRQPAHLRRLGLDHLLECIRRQPGNARQRELLRSAPRRRRAVSRRRDEPIRSHEERG